MQFTLLALPAEFEIKAAAEVLNMGMPNTGSR
jgi:hypothetical protein